MGMLKELAESQSTDNSVKSKATKAYKDNQRLVLGVAQAFVMALVLKGAAVYMRSWNPHS